MGGARKSLYYEGADVDDIGNLNSINMALLGDSNKRRYLNSSLFSSKLIENRSSFGGNIGGMQNYSYRSHLNSIVFSSHGVNSQVSWVEGEQCGCGGAKAKKE